MSAHASKTMTTDDMSSVGNHGNFHLPRVHRLVWAHRKLMQVVESQHAHCDKRTSGI